jgi:ActR/RegA family two-component response regulator
MVADRPYKLLLIDDDVALLSTLRRSLKRAGFLVTTARNAEEAFCYCADAPFDVAIVDIVLPGLDGLSAVDKIRAACPGIKVVIISGYYAEVPDVFLAKPVTGPQLTKVINALMLDKE